MQTVHVIIDQPTKLVLGVFSSWEAASGAIELSTAALVEPQRSAERGKLKIEIWPVHTAGAQL